MEYLYWTLAVIWVLGWIKELAEINSRANHYGIKYPSTAVKVALPIILLFTWPYWYFYGRAVK